MARTSYKNAQLLSLFNVTCLFSCVSLARLWIADFSWVRGELHDHASLWVVVHRSTYFLPNFLPNLAKSCFLERHFVLNCFRYIHALLWKTPCKCPKPRNVRVWPLLLLYQTQTPQPNSPLLKQNVIAPPMKRLVNSRSQHQRYAGCRLWKQVGSSQYVSDPLLLPRRSPDQGR